jgi:geranylgeranyl reductase family protein
MKYDALVIGAGPGGATCAWQLAREGFRVLMVDFKKSPGIPVQCAEFVPVQLKHRFKELFPPHVISQEVSSMVHFTPWEEAVTIPSEGYVLYRDKFDSNIVKLALQEGAELMLRTFFQGFEDGSAVLRSIPGRELIKVKADFIIGADGPRSRTARLTGSYTTSFLSTAQFTVPLSEPLEDLLIFFRDYIPGGYGWVFPKGKYANVGVGVDPAFGVNVMKSLRRFFSEVASSGLIGMDIYSRTGGWIPADGPLNPVRGRVLLVGDAGGFCHPITGAGIANAVLTGYLAAKAITGGDPEDYAEASLDYLGESLTRAANKRVKYMKSWDNLEYIIPRTWIAFDEYWKED